MPALDALVSELADVQDRLLALPDDAFAERFPLLKRRDELRQEVSQFQAQKDAGRTREQLQAEKAALGTRIEAIRGRRIDPVVQAGGGAPGSGQMGNLGALEINKWIEDAQGVPSLRARIAEIDQELARRDRESDQ